MFIRSQSLFLRPVWPEDHEVLHRMIGDAFDPGAVAGNSRQPRFLITLPGKAGAEAIGVGGLQRRDGRLEAECLIAPQFRNRGYDTEAISALSQIAELLD